LNLQTFAAAIFNFANDLKLANIVLGPNAALNCLSWHAIFRLISSPSVARIGYQCGLAYLEGEPMSDQIRVLGFAGSLRAKSLNRSLLRAATQLVPDSMQIEVFDLSVVPLYNGDVEEAGEPAGVIAFKDAIRRSDAALLVTPEYNHGVPGVMKNAVDWASRPPSSAPLARKPVGIIGASPGITGTARGQSQLRQAFEFTNSYCMPQPEVLVFRAHEKFDSDGELTDAMTITLLKKYLLAFADWALLFRMHAHPELIAFPKPNRD
jgi:chromate reductase